MTPSRPCSAWPRPSPSRLACQARHRSRPTLPPLAKQQSERPPSVVEMPTARPASAWHQLSRPLAAAAGCPRW
eukprot:7788745-Pyramimonas_sp.AAC.1